MKKNQRFQSVEVAIAVRVQLVWTLLVIAQLAGSPAVGFLGREFALRLFAAALVIVGIVLSGGAATALSISPNPVNATKPGFDADLNLISIVGDTMTVQVSVNVGTLTAFEVSLLTDGVGGFSFIPVVSSNAGTGDVAMVNLYNVANQGFFGPVNAGQTSDEIVLQFDAPITQGRGATSI
jgi:hypothetical protein